MVTLAHRRRGSLYVALLMLMCIASVVAMRASVLWDNVLRRETEEELAFRLIHLQRALDEGAARPDLGATELSALALARPPLLSRVPVDPVSGLPDFWIERAVGGAGTRLVVHPGAAGTALDDSAFRDWSAHRQGSTWVVAHSGAMR